MLNGVQVLDSQLPAASSDAVNQEVAPRGNRYAENYLQFTTPDGLDPLMAEGSYFSGVPTAYVPGTGIAGPTAQTAYSDTSAILAIINKATSGKKVIRPDTIKLICAAAGTALTAMRLVAVIDSAARVVTGGTALVFSPSGGIVGGVASISAASFGNLTVGAATPAKKIIGQCVLKAAAPAVNDEFVLRFSNSVQPSGTLVASTASTIVRHMEPIIILPGQALFLHYFAAAQTASPTFEPIVTTIER